MPIIKLQDGTEVHISQESYDALAKAVQEPKELTYDDIAYSLFLGRKSFYPEAGGAIGSSFFDSKAQCVTDPDHAPTKNQIKQLFALNMLHNVAYYLNEGWEPDWSNIREKKYWIVRDGEMNTIEVVINISMHHVGGVYFKSKELAERAIKILGEAKVKEAFGIFK